MAKSDYDWTLGIMSRNLYGSTGANRVNAAAV
jgi:hypothetical protein